MYDVAIVGSGPAAISAALTLKLHDKNIIWFGTPDLSKKVQLSERIANYPGVPMVSGADLNATLRAQVYEMGLEITDAMVTQINSVGGTFMLLANNEIYEARSILLAIGATAPKGYPGEDELLGHGVSYCATCDGFLYRNKRIAVFCGDKHFEHEAEFLAGLASEVYLLAPYKEFDASIISTWTRKDGSPAQVTIPEKPIKAIRGESRVEGVTLTDGTEIDLDGVFIMRPSIAPATMLKGLEVDGAHIVVDRAQKTNYEGVFAAGDCTGRPYQLTKAVGEGNVAAHNILEFLK